MDSVRRLSWICAGFLIFLCIAGYSSAEPRDSEISGTGQVVWIDLEGGFYGIITPDGTRYQPLNLPETYQYDGVVVDIIGSIVPDVMTAQMWGDPIEIRSISPVNRDNPFLQPWYAPEKTGSPDQESMPEHLIMAASGLQTGLDTIDDMASAIAENLTRNGASDEDPAGILSQGLDIPGVLEVILIDETGKLQTIVPEKYKRFEGEDVSGQEFNTRVLSYPVPAMSEYYTLIEGMDAVIICRPVFSDGMKIAGFVSVIIDPGTMTEYYALPYLNGTEYNLMVAQPDGTILYDGHQGMKGQKICNNSEFSTYPDLLSWAAHFQNAKAGTDRYTFYQEDPEERVPTDVIWTTVGLHGTPWRIFLLKR